MTHTHIRTHTRTSIQAVDLLKQAIQADTQTALRSAIKNAKSVAANPSTADFNPPELLAARDKLGAGLVRDEAEIRKLFKKHDENRSGTLSAAELVELCKELGLELDDDELMAAISALSALGDSSAIKYGEFFTWWKFDTIF
eukprot:FR739231.1.p2 GENE.FR739231.1~~FR739231.1.p2  ORF type:complete len:142 (+),score=13.97 FR739231.1:237-662(+)